MVTGQKFLSVEDWRASLICFIRVSLVRTSKNRRWRGCCVPFSLGYRFGGRRRCKSGFGHEYWLREGVAKLGNLPLSRGLFDVPRGARFTQGKRESSSRRGPSRPGSPGRTGVAETSARDVSTPRSFASRSGTRRAVCAAQLIQSITDGVHLTHFPGLKIRNNWRFPPLTYHNLLC